MIKFSKFKIGVMILSIITGAIAAEPKSPVLTSEFIFESAPYPQVHASTVVQSKTGLVAAWFGGTRESDPDVGIWVSRHEKGRWTPSVEVANGVQYTNADGSVHRFPAWNPVLFQPSNGPLMLFYKVGPDPRDWWGMLTLSQDGGRTWSEPRRLPDGILGPIKNKPVELPDGGILCPSSVEITGVKGKPGTLEDYGRWQVHFEYTKDFGRTWELFGPVNEGTEIQAIQPSILFLDKGRLLANGRTRQNLIFETESADGGRTWSQMHLGSLPNPNSGTDAVTLKDGRHLLVYNHVPGTPGKWGGKRSPLNIAISKDGHEWQAALVLESEPGEYSYPAIIQSDDGLVHITYTWKRSRIKHVVLDPSKLIGKDFVNGNWPQ